MRNTLTTLLLALGLLSSCQSQKAVSVNGEPVDLEDGLYAKLATTQGDILVQLDMERAPQTVANFVALAEGNHPLVEESYQGKPYFNGLTFHRVIPNFMIQGGDPQGNGSGGPGYEFNNEIHPELSHKKGVISMANAGPNTNGSQFFITVAPYERLDGGYSIFGAVVAGQDIADRISQVETDNRDKPTTSVVMEEVSIIRKGKAAKKFDAPAVFAEKQAENEAQKAAKEAAQQAMIDSLTGSAQVLEGDLYYEVIKDGEGPALEIGQSAKVNYAGYLMDGSLFDSNVEEIARAGGKYQPQRPYEPFAVQVGPQARVIEGWKMALPKMKVGDKWKLIIPPQLGYGQRGAPPVIPPNAWLIFEVEVLSAQ